MRLPLSIAAAAAGLALAGNAIAALVLSTK